MPRAEFADRQGPCWNAARGRSGFCLRHSCAGSVGTGQESCESSLGQKLTATGHDSSPGTVVRSCPVGPSREGRDVNLRRARRAFRFTRARTSAPI